MAFVNLTKEVMDRYNKNKANWPTGPVLTKEQQEAGVKPVAKQFLHSCLVRKTMDGGDAVVISELTHLSDKTAVPSLSTIINPKRSFYIAKPSSRNYDEKKEIESLQNLDKYTVENSKMPQEIYRHLNNGRIPNGRVQLRELLDSPYVYGADVGIETLCKFRFGQQMDKAGLTPAGFNVGFLDIEKRIGRSGDDNKEITLISYVHENQVYTAILKNAFYKYEDGNRIPGDLKELEEFSQKTLTPVIDDILKENSDARKAAAGKLPFKFNYFVGETEVDLIRWIFFHVHRNKTAFVGIWNIDYDLPEIIAVLKRHRIPLEDIFSYPGVHPGYRYARYQADDKKVDSLTDKWHWMHSTSFSQFVDSMCIYAKLRTVIGKEPSYSLDAILKKNNVGCKLHFPELDELSELSSVDWHRHMTEKEFYRYTVYNQFDVIAIMLMEWQNRDLQSMVQLSGVTPVAKFTKQTRKVADTLYTDWLPKGYVLGCASSDMKVETDKEMVAQGGAVLSPTRVDKAGMFAIAESPTLRTQLHPFVNDVDFTGMYPNCCQGANVSKDTKLSSVLYIFGEAVQRYHTPQKAVEVYFTYMTNPVDNGLRLAVEFYGAPTLETLDATFGNYLMEHGLQGEPEKLAA